MKQSVKRPDNLGEAVDSTEYRVPIDRDGRDRAEGAVLLPT
ncbi:hypothetical protein [Rhodococcoides kyotonense]|nr:hypothetical protein [Rhodococcus kyotonensis]